MSAEEKAKRDIKAISRFIGIMLIVDSLVFLISGVLIWFNIFPIVTIVKISIPLFIVITVFIPIYLNVSKRFRRS